MKFDHTKIIFGDHVQEHVKTSAGHRVTLLVRTFLNGQEVIVGAIHPADGGSWVCTWDLKGVSENYSASYNFNLVMTGAKRKMTGWQNIYPGGHISGIFHDSKEAAILYGSPNAVACIYREIEFEEGEGL